MTTMARKLITFYYRLCILPHASDVDGRRRELILNILLSGFLGMETVALLTRSLTHLMAASSDIHINAWVYTFVFWLITILLLAISRRGKPDIAAIIFIGFLLCSGLQFALVWGFGLADAELLFALTIVVAGVLFAAPQALVATSVVALTLMVVTYLQVYHLESPVTYWQNQAYELDDAVGFIAIFIIMGLVSWLANSETDRSLKRARRSEAALQKERDSLEAKVISRTRELEELQLARLLELQPFAEFGRIGAGLVHEIANPLTAASLHLEELSRQQHSDLVHQVQRSLHHLERYLLAARKQIKRESNLKSFSVGAELKQIINLLTNRARRAGVIIEVEKISNIRLYGDVVKFNQLIANLLANAIDALEAIPASKKQIIVNVAQAAEWVHIVIRDYGVGIESQEAEHLFEPFYSTKKRSARSGLGIGLALVKQYVEADFRGTIDVESALESGTTFTLHLKGQQR